MTNGPQYQRGAYRGTIVSQALGESSTGTPQFVFRFRVEAMVDGGQEFAVDEGERSCYVYLSEKTMDFAVRDIKSLGFDKNSLRYLDPKTPGFHDFTGQTVPMYCKHDTYNGKTNEKWSISNPVSFEVKPVDANRLRDIDNLFGRALKTAGGAPKAVKPKPAQSTEITDEDVPF